MKIAELKRFCVLGAVLLFVSLPCVAQPGLDLRPPRNPPGETPPEEPVDDGYIRIGNVITEPPAEGQAAQQTSVADSVDAGVMPTGSYVPADVGVVIPYPTSATCPASAPFGTPPNCYTQCYLFPESPGCP